MFRTLFYICIIFASKLTLFEYSCGIISHCQPFYCVFCVYIFFRHFIEYCGDRHQIRLHMRCIAMHVGIFYPGCFLLVSTTWNNFVRIWWILLCSSFLCMLIIQNVCVYIYACIRSHSLFCGFLHTICVARNFKK